MTEPQPDVTPDPPADSVEEQLASFGAAAAAAKALSGVEQPDPADLDAAPEDIQQDAIEELERIHQAQSFEQFGQGAFAAGYGMSPQASVPSPRSPLDFAPLMPERPAQAVPNQRELKTLEDLYDAYPDIGGGSTYLRIERKHPARFGGQHVAGFLCDMHEQISMGEFARRFGGQTYEVSVRGPGRATNMDGHGRIPARTLTSIRLTVPGAPIIDRPANGDSRMNAGSYPGHEDPRIRMRRMDLDADALKRSERREQELRRQLTDRNPVTPELMALLKDSADKQSEVVRSTTTEVILQLRQDNRRLSAALTEAENAKDALRQRVVDIQTDVAAKLREEESRQVRELKLQHETELRRIKEDHAASIQRQQTDHERRLADMTDRNQRERETLQNSEARERERLREDASRREKNLQDDFARREEAFRERERSVKDEFARREEAARRDYEMRMAQIERAQKRDLDVIRSSESTKAELAQQTAKVQTSLHMQEIQRLNAVAEAAERRGEQLQMELGTYTNKPLMQQVAEVKEIGDALGMFDKKDEPFDWKKAAMDVAGKLTEKIPEAARSFGEVREQNRMAVARAQEQAFVAQRRAEAMQRRGLTMTAAPPMMPATPHGAVAHSSSPHPADQRRVAPPPPPPGMTWDGGPPDPSAPTGLPPEPVGPPMTEPLPANPIGSHNPPAATPPPLSGGPAPPIPVTAPVAPVVTGAEPEVPLPSQAPLQPPAAPLPPAPAPAQVAHPQPAPAPAPHPLAAHPSAPQFVITEEQVAEFGQELEEAIQNSQIITPALFAAGFIEKVGPQAAHSVIMALTADQLVDSVAARDTEGKTQIVTRAGRKYVRELWEEVRKQISALTG